MRVPVEWIREYAPVRLSPEALAERLTMAGFEVTGIEHADGEAVFDLEITPNRADCLSVIGLAREIAAMTGTALKIPWQTRSKTARPAAALTRGSLAIQIEDASACRRYIGRLLEPARVAPSPEWMQRRLIACGIRPINNVVDITNYVLLETGQPLHAFDYDRVSQGRIVVRRARAGERIATLDGLTHELASEMLVIADAKEPIAVAGVMGGTSSEITPSTRRVLLESAEFDPIVVRRTGRRLGLASESSYRFERGVDPEGVAAASERAAALIAELASASPVAVRDVGRRARRPLTIALSSASAERRLGISVTAAGIGGLKRLGFGARAQRHGWQVTVPSFRRDVRHEVDLQEELARLHGYDRLPAGRPLAPMVAVRHDPAHEFATELRATLAAMGLIEIMTWALIGDDDMARVDAPATGRLRVANPLSRDHVVLRPTLLPGMLAAAIRNLAIGAPSIRMFELGAVFDAAQSGGQSRQLGVMLAGAWERTWQTRSDADGFRLKGLVELLVERVAGGRVRVESANVPWAEPGQGMALRLEDRPLGALGEVAARIVKRHDGAHRVWWAQLDVDALRASRRRAEAIAAPSLFPPVKRDLSVVVDRATTYDRVAQIIHHVGGPLTGRVELIDRYIGAPIPPEKQSLTFAIEYRDPSKTLTAGEVDQVHRAITQALIDQVGAQLR